MTKKSIRSYLILLAACILLLSLSKPLAQKMQGGFAAFVAPMWKHLSALKSGGGAVQNKEEELQQAKLENRLLKREVQRIKELLIHEQQVMRLYRTAGTAIGKGDGAEEDTLVRRHQQELRQHFLLRLEAVPAQVIYRTPSSWGCSLWINKGEQHNAILGRTVIAKNSPVVHGSALVGVIDYVGKEQSRVRLITDAGLIPSVRVSRGGYQRKSLAEQIAMLLDRFAMHTEILMDAEIEASFKTEMEQLRYRLVQESPSWHLAKGELYGSSAPLWRSRGNLLRGIGFNYDFPDEDGPSRDLRTGIPSSGPNKSPIPLLQMHDLLVTTGMDGVFPEGLEVAEVVSIKPLKEGDYYYELKAQMRAEDLENISTVFVIPPVGYIELPL